MVRKKVTDPAGVGSQVNKRLRRGLMRDPAAVQCVPMADDAKSLKVSHTQEHWQAEADNARSPHGLTHTGGQPDPTKDVSSRMKIRIKDPVRAELARAVLTATVDRANGRVVGTRVECDLSVDSGGDPPVSALMAALADLGVQVVFRSPCNPCAKGDVERAFRSMRTRQESSSRIPRVIEPDV